MTPILVEPSSMRKYLENSFVHFLTKLKLSYPIDPDASRRKIKSTFVVGQTTIKNYNSKCFCASKLYLKKNKTKKGLCPNDLTTSKGTFV